MASAGESAQQYLSADEVIARLGISKGTLYSYVSRGLIRSEETEGKTRARRYLAADVHALQQRKEQRRNPAKAATAALHFGDPVLESAITLIADGHLYYRGQDVLQLAQQRQFEEVAQLLWMGEGQLEEMQALSSAENNWALTPPANWDAATALLQQGDVAAALQTGLLATAASDLAAYNQNALAVAQTGMRILDALTSLLTVAATAGEHPAASRTTTDTLTIAQRLQRAWAPARPECSKLIDAALILCADHELNASSFTARCVASTGATPYAAVVAALAALQGYKHGGATQTVATFLRAAATDPARAVQEQLRAGGRLPGFGHLLYPDGDPRGALLLALADEYVTGSYVVAGEAGAEQAQLATAEKVCNLARQAVQVEPNLDFGLTVLACAAHLPDYAPFALFALGRAAGWIGHVIEQYTLDRLIRPRARYVGVQPPSAGAIDLDKRAAKT